MLFSKLNLDPGETIILEVRRHWFMFIWNVVLIALLALIPIIAVTLFIEFLSPVVTAFIEKYFFVVLFMYSLWALLLWVVLFLQWTNYYLDVWYITEKRIIDVNQKRIFHREVSNLRFDKIQDISIEVRGVIATFLNFGDLKVQTAAEDSTDFMLKNAARPEEVRRGIFSRHNREAERLHNQKTIGVGDDTPSVSAAHREEDPL